MNLKISKSIALNVVVILIHLNHLVPVGGQQIYRQVVDGMKFKEVSNYTVIPPKKCSYFDLEFDKFIPGNILFRTWRSAFWTANLQTLTADPIVGNDSNSGYQEGTGTYARFRRPRHIQWNETSLLIIDADVPRVRIVSRLTNTSSTVIGVCNKCSSAVNGSFSTHKLEHLHAIAKVPTQPNVAYVVQGVRETILIKLEFDTQSFSPLDVRIPFISRWEWMALLTSHPTEPVLYFYFYEDPYSGALGSVNVQTGMWNILIPSKGHAEGVLDGPVHFSLIGGAASSLVFLTDNVLMLSVGNYYHQDLRVIDLTTNTMSSVCKPDSISSSPDCDVLSSNPQSLLVDKEKDIVIIGHQGYLSYLQIDGLNNITETTTAMTTTTSMTTTRPQTSTYVPATSGSAQITLIIGVSLGGVGFIMLVASTVLIIYKQRLHRTDRSREEPTVEFSTGRSEPDRDYEELGLPDRDNHQYEACNNSGRDMMTRGYVNLTLND